MLHKYQIEVSRTKQKTVKTEEAQANTSKLQPPNPCVYKLQTYQKFKYQFIQLAIISKSRQHFLLSLLTDTSLRRMNCHPQALSIAKLGQFLLQLTKQRLKKNYFLVLITIS